MAGYNHAINLFEGYYRAGILQPFDVDSIAQWLYTLRDDGITLADKLTVVSPEPTTGGANCLEFTLGQHIDFPAPTYGDVWSFTVSGYFNYSSEAYAHILTNQNASTSSGVVALIRGAAGAGCSLYLRPDGATANENVTILGNVFDSTYRTISVTYDNGAVTIDNNGTITTATITHYDGFTSQFKLRLGANSLDSQSLDGYIYNVEIDGNLNAKLAEGSGLPKDTSGNGNNATDNTATWATDDSIESANHKFGHTPSVGNLVAGQYIDLGDETNIGDKEFRIETTHQGYVVGTALWGIGTTNARLMSYKASTGFNMYYGAVTRTIQDTSTGMTEDVKVDTVFERVGDLFQTSVNGISAIPTDVTGESPASANMYLYSTSGAAFPTITNFYSWKLWVEGVLTRDMIPLANGEFLDRVNNVVYSNDGTGTLTTRYSTALNDGTDAMPTKSVATFDGVADYVDTGIDLVSPDGSTVEQFDVSTTFTLQNEAPAYTTFWGRGRFGGGSIACQLNSSNESPVIEARIRSDTTIITTTSSTVIESEVEYTVRLTWDGSSVMRLYVNGVLEDETVLAIAGVFATGLNIHIGDGTQLAAGGEVYFGGDMKHMSIDGVLDYDFTDYLGKTTDTITDLSGNGNDGAVSSPTAGLDGFWGKRYEDSTGVVVDSANYLPIEWEGGYVNNNSECFVDQNSTYFDTYANLWNNGVIGATVQFYYKDFTAYLSGLYNGWIKYVKAGEDNCHVQEVYQYIDGYVDTLKSWTQNANYIGQGGGCGSINPFL